VRNLSLAILIFFALPSAAQDSTSLGDLLSATGRAPVFEAASQPLFEMPVQIRTAADIQFKTSRFTFVRISYSRRGEAKLADTWAVDYPGADTTFTEQVQYLTGLTTDSGGQFAKLTDPTLGQYPFIYIVEGGKLGLDDDEAVALRSYLLGGGFLMVDDFWGEAEWASLSAEFRKVFPEREIIELPDDHEVFRSYFRIDEKSPVPGIREWMTSNADGKPLPDAHYRGLIGDDGRLMAIFCHNADFGDGWEHASTAEYPLAFSFGQAIPMGINIVVYALSH